jgi:phosphate transport system substrate-binding protein
MKIMRTQAQGMLGLALLLAMTGCGGGGAGDNGPRGEVIIDGSSTVYRISKAAQEGYHNVNPDVLVVVGNHGTGGGFGRYLQGEVDIVDASRTAKEEEESKAKAQGIEWTRFHVGYDGITLVVHPSNDFVKSLTVEQLKALWEPDSKVQTWKDLDPSWPDRRIMLYGPDNDSGTYEFFVEAILGKGKSERSDVQASSDDNTLVNGVANDRDGLGYFGYAYYAANPGKLRPVPIQNGPDAKPVLPDPKTILDKTYSPLSRRLYIYVKNSALRRPEVAGFLKYYLSNVAELAVKARYVAPTPDDLAANHEAWSEAPAVPKPASAE